MLHLLLCLTATVVGSVYGLPLEQRADPLVTLSYATFQGFTAGNVDTFLGIPYAQVPTGDLRFAPPQAPTAFNGTQLAVEFGAACPQQGITLPELLPANVTLPLVDTIISENCLSLNVYRPASASPGDNLPVIFWIYGGAFEIGDSALTDGTVLVERSLTLGEPVIFVSHNYRMNAFGFLASEEVLAANATNIGLRDQRFAMEWVQQYISEFGGDPSEVTIWGESAGAYSVSAHLIWNGGNTGGLFRSAIIESGPPVVLPNVSQGQQYYDQLVELTGCSGESDTFACLQNVPYDELIVAVADTPSFFSYQSLDLAWLPRMDGVFIKYTGPEYLQAGLYAKVPVLIGDCDDEGTLFSFANANVTTDQEFLEYIQTYYLYDASTEDIAAVGEAYPTDPTDGSPFDTGYLNVLTPQFKRLAAFQGDWMWQAPRRYFLETVSQTQDAWAYLYKRGKWTPYLGSFHASDLLEFFDAGDFIGMDAVINFATNLNPNAPADLAPGISYLSDISWDQWSSDPAAPPLLTFVDPAPLVEITADTFRADAMQLLNQIALELP